MGLAYLAVAEAYQYLAVAEAYQLAEAKYQLAEAKYRLAGPAYRLAEAELEYSFGLEDSVCLFEAG